MTETAQHLRYGLLLHHLERGTTMQGSLLVKRDPAAIGTVLVALVMLLGNRLGWSIELTGSISGLIMAGVGIIMAANTFGTDSFTSVAVNFVAAAAALYAAWSGLPVNDEVMTLIITFITVMLGLFVRNGVTNQFGPTGQRKLAPGAAGATAGGVAGNEAAFPAPTRFVEPVNPGDGPGTHATGHPTTTHSGPTWYDDEGPTTTHHGPTTTPPGHGG